MQRKIKPQRIQSIQFLMLRDLLVENLLIPSFKRIANYGHLKLKLDQMINQSLLSNIKTKPKNSILNKFHQWFLPRWRKLLKHLLDNPLKMQLSLYLLISMTIKDRQPRMLEVLLASMFWESSMSQLLPLLLMD